MHWINKSHKKSTPDIEGNIRKGSSHYRTIKKKATHTNTWLIDQISSLKKKLKAIQDTNNQDSGTEAAALLIDADLIRWL